MIRKYWLGSLLLAAPVSLAAPSLDTVKNMTGCFLVDYSYSEHKVLDPEYILDSRVYDSNRFAVKELIKNVSEDSSQVRLQHFMQADSHSGETLFMMRHHAETWKKSPEYRYKYVGRFEGNDRWEVEELEANEDTWLRSINFLDDGLRYQCLGSWESDHKFSRFNCNSYSPIPGRESRDMGRKDYNTLDRSAELTIYPSSWLERQKNTKIQFIDGQRTPLVEELGKVWSVRLPDSECSDVAAWADERQAFWNVLAQVWDEIYAEKMDFHEIKIVDDSSRSRKIAAIQEQYYKAIAKDPTIVETVKNALRDAINSHRI